MNNKKILVCGDLHLKDTLSYSEYFKDKRENERKEILSFIVKQSEDCDGVIFLGDLFNAKNNTSYVNREFVNFIERFGNKELFFISGNHEKLANGNTALDFLTEIKDKNWHIFTKGIHLVQDNLVFCPYFYSSEFGVDNNEDACKKLMKDLSDEEFSGKDKILFAHHAVSNTKIGSINSDFFTEIVLPQKKISSLFKQVFLGHIHSVKQIDNILYCGSVFRNEVGDENKKIFKYDGENIEEIALPGRNIFKLENPPDEVLEKMEKSNILKVYISDRKYKINKELLESFDAYTIREVYEEERKVDKERMVDLQNISMEQLLDIYAKDKSIDINQLKNGFNLLNV